MISQVGQDKWVCEYFNYKRDGYFIDIGAFNGVDISNTYYLEKELEWNGVCVEAGLTNFEQCRNNRTCQCVNKAVSDRNGKGLFKENWTVGLLGPEGTEIETITLRKLLKDNNCPQIIDYISLDIEGEEYLALTKFPFKSYEVILWTIEHNMHLDGGRMKEQIRALMKLNGYMLITSKPQEAQFEDWFVNCKYDNNKVAWQVN